METGKAIHTGILAQSINDDWLCMENEICLKYVSFKVTSDGRFGAYIASHFNLKNVSIMAKNKSPSLRQVFKILKEGNYIGITPDGPRGPNRKVSEGIIKIAVHSQVPIIPLGFASNKNFELKSWDSFLITYPFAKCNFVWGDNYDSSINKR